MATATVAKRTTKKTTVGALIDAMYATREKRRVLAAQDDELKKEYAALEGQLLQMMDAEGVIKSTGKMASAGISENDCFNITDWDKFTAYVSRNKFFHFFQRRLSDPSIREIVEKKGAVPPGLEKFTKRTIGLRNL